MSTKGLPEITLCQIYKEGANFASRSGFRMTSSGIPKIYYDFNGTLLRNYDFLGLATISKVASLGSHLITS